MASPMIVVTGDVALTRETYDEGLRLAREHVARSRLEAGCLSHAVHRDLEDEWRLVFFEEWSDRPALDAHFAVPASRAFGKALMQLARRTPTLTIYDATKQER